MQEHEEVLETVCELYRCAPFTGIVEYYIFAYKGISWVIRQYTNLKLPKFMEIAKTYGHAALRLTHRSMTPDSAYDELRSLVLNSCTIAQLDTAPQTIHAAIKEGDLVSILVMLRDTEATNPNDMNEHAVDLAAAQGWRTVVKALTELQEDKDYRAALPWSVPRLVQI